MPRALHPLEQRVALVARRRQRMLVAYALGQLALNAGLAALALGGLDYLVRSSDTGLRVLASLAWWALVAWSLGRFVLPALTGRLTPVETARGIERHFPALADRLASAIDFLGRAETDPTAGSPALRRAAVAEASDEIARLDLPSVLDPRPVARMGLAVLAVVVAIASCGAYDFSSTRLALARLVAPWREAHWPRWNELEFVGANERVALGSSFTAVVCDRHDRLPAEVQIEFRLVDAAGKERKLVRTMMPVAGRMEHTLENVTGSFRMRALGGDGETRWHAVEALEPPRVARVNLELHPPDYTRWPAHASPRRIEALAGTWVSLQGEATLPLAAAKLHVEANGTTQTFPLELEEEGLRFWLSAQGNPAWRIEHSGAYWLELETRDGLRAVDARWELRCLADRPPRIECRQPAVGELATPRGIVPLKFEVSDDVEIERVELVIVRSNRTAGEPERRVLYRATERGGKTPPGAGEGEPADLQTVDYAWSLAALDPLAPGDVLSIQGVAHDFLPQSSATEPVRITLVSPDDLRERLGQRLAQIVAQLLDVLKKEEATRAAVAAISVQVMEVGRLAKPDLDRLQALELSQREVERTLVHPQEGAARQLARLLAQYQANALPVEGGESLAEFLAELKRLGNEPLPGVQRALLAAIKMSQAEALAPAEKSPAAAARNSVAQSLAEAQVGQTEVIESLERWLGRLTQWQNYSRFAREIESLRHDQSELLALAEAHPTLAQVLADLTLHQRADLKRLAEGQLELARRFDRMLVRMDEFRAQIAATEPSAAAALHAALTAGRQLPIGGLMREAGRNLEANRLGAAAQEQQQVVVHLGTMLDELSGRAAVEAAERVKGLREAAALLERLHAQQSQIAGQLAAAANEPNEGERQARLAQGAATQANTADELRRLERQLERAGANAARQSVEKGAEQAAGAAAGARQGDGKSSAGAAQAAAQALNQARRELAQALEQAKQQLAGEHLAKLEHLVAGFIARQQGALDELKRLQDERRSRNGDLSRSQLTSLAELARLESLLSDETALHAENEALPEGFRLAFAGTARSLKAAHEALASGETGPLAQQPAEQALARLRQIATSLKPPAPPTGNEPPAPTGSGAGGQNGESPGPTLGPAALAELKLVRLMQEQINDRTRELETAATAAKPGPATRQELENLAAEQGKLATVIARLLASLAAEPPANPPKNERSPR